MAFDFKKEYRELYLPKSVPSIVTVPPMSFLAVRGKGDPNTPDGEYQRALQVLYTLAFTIKMSKHGDRRMEGYFDYVVPPLEGLWQQSGIQGIDYAHKERFEWVSLIRLPDFVTPDDLAWAKEEAARKKKADCSSAEFLVYDEGLCVQCMHVGSYDDEPVTVEKMHAHAAQEVYEPDFSGERRHHEIYLSDARRVPPEKRRTVVRHPVRRIGGTA